MSLYSIADLHLSTLSDKPMDIFGPRWVSHADKIRKNWCAIVKPEDTVVIPGDISWGLSMKEALPDFVFIDTLPGHKIIGKGNHDFWWSTVSAMKRTLTENGIHSIDFLNNNAYETEDFILCGTRGWFMEEKQQKTQNETDFDKMIARETQRLTLSLQEGRKLQKDSQKEILVFLHFPPVYRSFLCEPLINVLKSFGIQRTFFGHIHADYTVERTLIHEGISFTIISADYLQFIPLLITP